MHVHICFFFAWRSIFVCGTSLNSPLFTEKIHRRFILFFIFVKGVVVILYFLAPKSEKHRETVPLFCKLEHKMFYRYSNSFEMHSSVINVVQSCSNKTRSLNTAREYLWNQNLTYFLQKKKNERKFYSIFIQFKHK